MVACNPPTPQLAGTLYSNRAAAALKLKLGSRWAVCTLLLPLSNLLDAAASAAWACTLQPYPTPIDRMCDACTYCSRLQAIHDGSCAMALLPVLGISDAGALLTCWFHRLLDWLPA